MVLGRIQLDPAGQPPLRFEISYDNADIHREQRYTLHATISRRGQLRCTTDRMYPVLDGGNRPLHILLVPVGMNPGLERGNQLFF